VDFYDGHAAEQEQLEGDLAAAWGKLEGYCARLALVIQIVKGAISGCASLPNAVGSNSVKAAVTLVRWFGYEAKRVYAALGEDDVNRERRRLIEWIQARGGSVTVREIQQLGTSRYRGSAEVADAALEELAKDGAGNWVEVPAGGKGGRPTRQFHLTVATELG
jgi:hypothetical protein